MLGGCKSLLCPQGLEGDLPSAIDTVRSSLGCNMVLGTAVKGRKWPQSVLGVPAPCTGLRSCSSCPGTKPGKQGNDSSHLMVM